MWYPHSAGPAQHSHVSALVAQDNLLFSLYEYMQEFLCYHERQQRKVCQPDDFTIRCNAILMKIDWKYNSFFVSRENSECNAHRTKKKRSESCSCQGGREQLFDIFVSYQTEYKPFFDYIRRLCGGAACTLYISPYCTFAFAWSGCSCISPACYQK